MAARLQPCGTAAAYRRHYREGAPVTCEPCKAAWSARTSLAQQRTRGGIPDGRTPDRREVRNALPVFRPYVYRGCGEDVLTGHLTVHELLAAAS